MTLSATRLLQVACLLAVLSCGRSTPGGHLGEFSQAGLHAYWRDGCDAVSNWDAAVADRAGVDVARSQECIRGWLRSLGTAIGLRDSSCDVMFTTSRIGRPSTDSCSVVERVALLKSADAAHGWKLLMLLGAAMDTDGLVVKTASSVTAAQGPSCIPILLATYESSTDMRLRQWVAVCAGLVDSRASEPLLGRAAADPDDGVRRAALHGLMKLQRPPTDQTHVLRACVRQERGTSRLAAAVALLRAAPTETDAIRVLMWGLQHPDADFRAITLKRYVGHLNDIPSALRQQLCRLLTDETPVYVTSSPDRVCWIALNTLLVTGALEPSRDTIGWLLSGASGRGRIAAGLAMLHLDAQHPERIAILSSALREDDAYVGGLAFRLMRRDCTRTGFVDPELVRVVSEVASCSWTTAVDAATALLTWIPSGRLEYARLLRDAAPDAKGLLVRVLEDHHAAALDMVVELEHVASSKGPGGRAASMLLDRLAESADSDR